MPQVGLRWLFGKTPHFPARGKTNTSRLATGGEKEKNMYYEEKIINGVLCFRNTPKGEWIKFSDIELTKEVLRLKEYVKQLETQLQFKMYY